MKIRPLIVCILFGLLIVACGGGDSEEPPPDINLQGDENTVTDNYKLPECQKSVFIWSIEPDDEGNAAFIVHLHKKGKDDYKSVVNELEFSATETLKGEEIQPLAGGEYFFSIENVKGKWTLRWECRD